MISLRTKIKKSAIVDPKKEWITVKNKDADASEKKSSRQWGKGKKTNRGTSTYTKTRKQKFKGANTEMKEHVFDLGRNQENDYRHTMLMLEKVTGVTYSAAVSSAITILNKNPAMIKKSTKPTIEALIVRNKVTNSTTDIPDKYLDLYKEKMKKYAKKEPKFELDCKKAYLMVKRQCSPSMITELKCHDDYDDIQEGYNVKKLLKLIKKICYNYKTQGHPLQAITKATSGFYSTNRRTCW